MDQKGAAPTLAVFLLFVLLCSAAAFSSFQAGHQRQVSTIQQLIAVDVVRATTSTIEDELNETLRTTLGAALYDVAHMENKTGMSLEQLKENVENKVRVYLNERISLGWGYSNMTVWVENCNENNLELYWCPDGSIGARGYMKAEITHVAGATANGISLDMKLAPRFERLFTVAKFANKVIENAADPEAIEQELNDNYACEYFLFDAVKVNGRNRVITWEIFGGKIIVKE